MSFVGWASAPTLQIRQGSQYLLIIAHRLRTVRRADRVLVIEHGRIVEEGTHAVLAEGTGVYGKLYRAELRD